MTPAEYPWYEVVDGNALEQGDILLGFPIIVPSSQLEFPLPAATAEAELQVTDVIVMTQSCDLVNEKLEDIILCPHWDLLEAGKMDPTLGKKAWKSILKGREHRYAMLDGWNSEEISMGVRLVDFGRIFSLPKSFVSQYAAIQGKRLRLSPPYREHLSQSFARFFMRVGLPQDITLPE